MINESGLSYQDFMKENEVEEDGKAIAADKDKMTEGVQEYRTDNTEALRNVTIRNAFDPQAVPQDAEGDDTSKRTVSDDYRRNAKNKWVIHGHASAKTKAKWGQAFDNIHFEDNNNTWPHIIVAEVKEVIQEMKQYGHVLTAPLIWANSAHKCRSWLWQIGCGWVVFITYSETSHLPCAYFSDWDDL